MGLVVGLLKKLRKSELLNKLSCSWTVYFEAQFQVPTNQTKVQMDSTTANESESLCHRCQWPKLTLAQCFTVYKARSYISCLSVSRSVVSDSATPWSVTHQAPLSRGFPRQEYLNGLPFPSPGGLPWLGDWTHVSCIDRRNFFFFLKDHWANREAKSLIIYV